jgi:predicted amidophosphoribosyltransferase
MGNEVTTKEFERGWRCPKCGARTETFRHLFARIWCPTCEYELHKDGDTSPSVWNGERPPQDMTVTTSDEFSR